MTGVQTCALPIWILAFPSTRPHSTIFLYSHWFDPFPVLSGTVYRYSHGFSFSLYSPIFYHFLVLTYIRPFIGTRRDSLQILAGILFFPRTCPDSTIFRYSHRFDPFPVLVGTVFRYSKGFYLFPVLAPILPFFGPHIDWTLFRYSSEQFFDTGTDSTFSWYSPGFCHFLVLTLIRPFFGTQPKIFLILARILPFFGTHRDSTLFPVVAGTVFRYSQGFYLFPVLARILFFPSTNPDSTIFQYLNSFDPFLVVAGTVFRYSHGF